MNRRTKLIAAGVSVLAIGAGGAAVALGTGEDDSAEQVSGAGADKAVAAALEITGGGEANSVELDSENGAVWEVEVTTPDGNTVDVRLDDNCGEVAVEDDTEDNEDGDED